MNFSCPVSSFTRRDKNNSTQQQFIKFFISYTVRSYRGNCTDLRTLYIADNVWYLHTSAFNTNIYLLEATVELLIAANTGHLQQQLLTPRVA